MDGLGSSVLCAAAVCGYHNHDYSSHKASSGAVSFHYCIMYMLALHDVWSSCSSLQHDDLSLSADVCEQCEQCLGKVSRDEGSGTC